MEPEFNQYFQYFAEMPGYVTVQDRDYRIIDANKRFREDFGDYEGRYCYQIYKGRSERCEVCPVARTFRDGLRHESQEMVRTLSGHEVSTIVYTKPIRDGAGTIIAVMEVSTDITHIRNLHDLLSKSQQRCRLLFDEVPCYISIQDHDLNVIEANRAFQETFGNSLGLKCYEAYKHRSEPCAPCPVQQTLDDGLSHSREEIVTSRDGRRINTLVTTAPLKNELGQITGVMEMSANITQIRELEDRLTSLGLLIGSVSHGLKGLLNGLAGGMYLVDTGMAKGNEERVTKGWETVKRNVSRIRNMVSDILYYAKDRVPNWEPQSPGEIAEEATLAMENRSREEKIELVTEFESDVGVFQADGQAVRAMLMNLLENAFDACRLDEKKTEHRVHFRLRGFRERIEFEVEDNGIGMDRETQEKAFTLFFSSKGTGTGLGLFIADKIAHAHGGSIELKSEPAAGSRFVVQLPREAPVAEESAGQQDADTTPSTEKEVTHG